MPKLSSRLLRRAIIAVVFLAVFFALGYGTRQLTKPVVSCTDGIMNGEEEGIDCGLFACGNYCEPDLEPPVIVSTTLLKANDKDYDFVGVIKNPHAQFGSPDVVYELTFYNGDDEELAKREGTFYILPGQTKYLIVSPIVTEKNIERTELVIKSAKWQKLDSLEGLNLVVRREVYEKATDGKSSSYSAIIFNDTDFDFESIDIDIALKNSKGDIIAVNKSDIKTFRARTERHFVVMWPFPIAGAVTDVDVSVSTNLFVNSNFIKRYGSTIQKFQQYK